MRLTIGPLSYPTTEIICVEFHWTFVLFLYNRKDILLTYRLDGYVVCEEYAEVLTDAWHKEQQEMEKKQRKVGCF